MQLLRPTSCMRSVQWPHSAGGYCSRKQVREHAIVTASSTGRHALEVSLTTTAPTHPGPSVAAKLPCQTIGLSKSGSRTHSSSHPRRAQECLSNECRSQDSGPLLAVCWAPVSPMGKGARASVAPGFKLQPQVPFLKPQGHPPECSITKLCPTVTWGPTRHICPD